MTFPLEDRPAIDGDHMLDACPFLRSRDGSWSSSHSSNELRCWAVRPTAQLAIPKQRALCLRARHDTCATFVAASAVDADVAGTVVTGTADLWPATRSVTVLDPVRPRGALPAATPRSGVQALLIGLMVVAFLVLVIARTTTPGESAGTPGASASPSGTGSLPGAVASLQVGASPSPPPGTLAPSAVPTVSPAPSATPTARPTRSPAPSLSPSAAGTQRYTVQTGDTLASIAGRFNTTGKAIAAANGITDVRIIHVGQVLVIP
jgi:LysM repeat protein